jgi:hypothetical protein
MDWAVGRHGEGGRGVEEGFQSRRQDIWVGVRIGGQTITSPSQMKEARSLEGWVGGRGGGGERRNTFWGKGEI